MVVFKPVHVCLVCACPMAFNMFAASLWLYRTWKSGKNQGYFSWITNHI